MRVGEAAASPCQLRWGGAASPPKLFPNLRIFLFTVFFLGLFGSLHAQPKVEISVGGKWVEHFPQDPPNRLKDKYVLTAESARQLPQVSGGGVRALLKDFKIEQFSLTGTNPILVAKSPECIYDRNRAQVHSDFPLNIVAQEGKMVTDGIGFLLDQKSSTLFLSNKVHSVIQNLPDGKTGSTNFTDITSETGRFLSKTETSAGAAIYQRNVQVIETNMQLSCEHLVVDAPRESGSVSNRPNNIIADTNVVIEFVTAKGEHVHATGEHAVYTRTGTNEVQNEFLELSGNPVLLMSNNWMTADYFYYDRAAGLLRGSNNYVLHYFSQAGSRAAGQHAGDTNAVVFSGQFLMEVTNHIARFWDGVRAEDASKTLACEYLTAKMTASNRIDEFVAETNVVIVVIDEKSKQRVHTTSQRAVYTSPIVNGQTNEILVLTEGPVALFKDGQMQAQKITMDKLARRIRGEGNQHTILRSTNPGAASQNVEIFSELVDVATDTGVSIYQKNVRAYDPQMSLSSSSMVITPPKSGAAQSSHPESIKADGDVAIKYASGPFFPGDITNAAKFKEVLGKSTAARRFVSARLPMPDQKKTDTPNGATNQSWQMPVVTNLNRLVIEENLASAVSWAGAGLSAETLEAMTMPAIGEDRFQLNRLLLLDLFRGALGRNQKGDEVRGNGDHAIYTCQTTAVSTNEVLRLMGNPRLENDSGYWTATNTIIDEITTGTIHAEGEPHLHVKLEALTSKGMTGKQGQNQSRTNGVKHE